MEDLSVGACFEAFIPVYTKAESAFLYRMLAAFADVASALECCLWPAIVGRGYDGGAWQPLTTLFTNTCRQRDFRPKVV